MAAMATFPVCQEAVAGVSHGEPDPTNPFDVDLTDEADANEIAAQGSDNFNALPGREELDADGELSFVLDPDDDRGGVPAALAADFGYEADNSEGRGNPLQDLMNRTMHEHLAHPSPGDPGGRCLVVIDHRIDIDGARTLPLWSPHGPAMQNVVLAVIADRTHEVRPLRGGLTVAVLAEYIRAGRIKTVCSVRTHPECTPFEPKHVFTLKYGNYVVFFRACASCYFRDFEGYGNLYGGICFENLDPIEHGEIEYDGDLPDIDYEP